SNAGDGRALARGCRVDRHRSAARGPLGRARPEAVKRVGIDASNLRVGGGLTHLVELLRAADPGASGFERVVVWGRAKTLERLEPREWLETIPVPALEHGVVRRVLWQQFALPHAVRDARCDVLFSPGGSAPAGVHPLVTMSRNLLPFEWREL